ncbi:MAG: tetratricopeptide repeat protein [Candidatus Moranbacteria bacterium]|nr:tetratricopeptide repeat protein [Candidatus Moranbacteria bacterium]
MSLDNRQKQYIKKNLRKIPLVEIAEDIGVSEENILDYLKKKWPREKYERFLKGRFEAESESDEAGGSFNFWNFLSENRLVLGFLALLVLLSYANSFFNGFVSDDVGGFLNNPSLGHISNVFAGSAHFSVSAFFQYVAFHIGGLHPFTFRTINILSHLGCVVVIYLLLTLAMNKRVATIAASIFAVHPILTESVSWISGGLYSLYAFFFLLSLLFYLFSENDKKYFRYSVLFYVIAIFSSEKALVLFLVFALYEIAFGSLKYNWKKILPFFSISIFLLIIYALKIGYRVSAVETQSYQAGGGIYNPLIQIPVTIGSYLKLIFWPAKLTLYQTEMSFSQAQYLILLFITLIYLGAIFWSWRKNKNVFFWLCFFVITLLPTLTPLKISWIVAERYVYLGTLGIIIVVAILFDKFLKLNENAKMVGYFALVVIVATLSARTIIRNQDWKSEDTLWIATAQVAPSGQQIHNNLGDVYARQGDMQRAADEFKKAIEINPNYADAYHNLGNTYQQMNQLDLAIENYQKALSINPNLWQSYQNLAAIYFNQGQFDLAEENIKKAAEINPNDENLKQNVQVIEAKLQGQ